MAKSKAKAKPVGAVEDIAEAVRTDFWALRHSGPVENYLPAFAGAEVPYLMPDLRSFHELARFGDADNHLDPHNAAKLTSLVAWLFVSRPVGCSIRGGIARVVPQLRAVLEDPRTVWPTESKYYDEEPPKKRLQRHAALVELVGGKRVERPGGAEADWVAGRDDGTIVVAPHARSATPESHNGQACGVYGGFWTAKIRKHAKRIEEFARKCGDWKTLPYVTAAADIMSDGFAAFAARVADTDLPAGGYEANPLLSAPKLVVTVSKKHGISSDAAALYLETLALAEPTRANVLVWNAWTAEHYEEAAADLVKKKLVVVGKHKQADRTIFLEGPVSNATELGGRTGRTLLNRPLEKWKLPLYARQSTYQDKYLVNEPCHLVFARAWKAMLPGGRAD